MKRDSLISTEEKLLFDILQELKEINRKLPEPEPLRPIAKATEEREIQCKYCGGSHDNKGQFLACARKHKKHKKKEGA
jgi:hypothetical protein